jgi:hypothetical protein
MEPMLTTGKKPGIRYHSSSFHYLGSRKTKKPFSTGDSNSKSTERKNYEGFFLI